MQDRLSPLLALRAFNDGQGSESSSLGNSVGHTVRQMIDVARRVTGQSIVPLAQRRRPGDPDMLVPEFCT